MSSLGKLTGIATVGKLLVDYQLYQRAAPRIILLLMLATGTGILASVLVMAVFTGVYFLLVEYGLSYPIAFLIIALWLMVTVIAGLILIRHHVRKLRKALQPLAPISEGISDIVTAFADGFRRD